MLRVFRSVEFGMAEAGRKSGRKCQHARNDTVKNPLCGSPSYFDERVITESLIELDRYPEVGIWPAFRKLTGVRFSQDTAPFQVSRCAADATPVDSE